MQIKRTEIYQNKKHTKAEVELSMLRAKLMRMARHGIRKCDERETIGTRIKELKQNLVLSGLYKDVTSKSLHYLEG